MIIFFKPDHFDWKLNKLTFFNQFGQVWKNGHFEWKELSLQCNAISMKVTSLMCINSQYVENVAHAGFFRLLMKVIFDPYILWPYDPKNDFLISNTCWNLFIKNKYQIPTEFLNNYWRQLLNKQPSTKFSFSVARKRCHRHFFCVCYEFLPPFLTLNDAGFLVS